MAHEYKMSLSDMKEYLLQRLCQPITMNSLPPASVTPLNSIAHLYAKSNYVKRTPPRPNIKLPCSTPTSFKHSGYAAFAGHPTGDAIKTTFRKEIVQEICGRFVGPMPIDDFFQDFLPPSDEVRPSFRKTADWVSVPKIGSENKEPMMYGPFIKQMTPFLKHMKLVDTSNKSDMAYAKHSLELKPDVCLYHSRDDDIENTNFSKMELWIEFKPRSNQDPFRHPAQSTHPEFEYLGNDQNKETISQLTTYATACIGSQFRPHLFSVGIFGDVARLIRWDRAGAIVTEPIMYDDDPEILMEFFWRYSRMDPGLRGHDTTIEAPSYETPSDNEVIARARDMLQMPNHVEILRFKVGDTGPDGGTVKTYLGPRPDLTPASPTGRCTCGFQVVDEATMQKVYMKDSWRLLLDGVVSETDAYKRLQAAKVPFIAPFECGADVLEHMTITDVYREKAWAKATAGMMKYRHCRMVLGIAGQALTTFNSTRQLTQCVRDAIVAHKAAYEDARLLHRDISVGNIMIGDNGRGCLIDWDLCKDADNLATNGKRLERTGTWQFMSGMLLREPGKLHVLADDLESFVHVLTWTCIRYGCHGRDGTDVEIALKDIYNYTCNRSTGVTGGDHKIAALRTKSHLDDFRFQKSDENPHEVLNWLLEEITSLVAMRYARFRSLKPFDLRPNNAKESENCHGEKTEAVDKLKTSDALLQEFDAALRSSWDDLWPKNDVAVDKLRRVGKRVRVDEADNVAALDQPKRSRISVAHTYAGAGPKEGSNSSLLPSAM